MFAPEFESLWLGKSLMENLAIVGPHHGRQQIRPLSERLSEHIGTLLKRMFVQDSPHGSGRMAIRFKFEGIAGEDNENGMAATTWTPGSSGELSEYVAEDT
jgi:hypothetical protein